MSVKVIQGIKFLEFNTTGAVIYNSGQSIKPYKGCNAIIITNTGDGIIMCNGRVLYPGVPGTSQGDAFTYGGNFGEIFTGIVNVSVISGAAPEYSVEQKFYTCFD